MLIPLNALNVRAAWAYDFDAGMNNKILGRLATKRMRRHEECNWFVHQVQRSQLNLHQHCTRDTVSMRSPFAVEEADCVRCSDISPTMTWCWKHFPNGTEAIRFAFRSTSLRESHSRWRISQSINLSFQQYIHFLTIISCVYLELWPQSFLSPRFPFFLFDEDLLLKNTRKIW